VEQVAEDNFAEVVEQGALQLQERLAKKSNEASPKLRRNRQNSQSSHYLNMINKILQAIMNS
jgi:hypothetical protein